MKKLALVRDIFVSNQQLSRKELISLVVSKIGGTEASAATYLSNVRKELGLAPLKRGRPRKELTATETASVRAPKPAAPKVNVVKPTPTHRQESALASRPFKDDAKRFIAWRSRQTPIESVIYDEMGFSDEEKFEARQILAVEMGRSVF